eukprot:6209391-Pleurochrysis_carterae.AAC.2
MIRDTASCCGGASAVLAWRDTTTPRGRRRRGEGACGCITALSEVSLLLSSARDSYACTHNLLPQRAGFPAGSLQCRLAYYDFASAGPCPSCRSRQDAIASHFIEVYIPYLIFA